MSYRSDTIEKMITALKTDSRLLDTVVRKGFPLEKKPNPMKKVHIAVKIADFSSKYSAFGAFFGKIDGIDYYGKREKSTLRVSVFYPLDYDPTLRDEVLTAVTDCVERCFDVESWTAGELIYRREDGAICQDVTFVLKEIFCLKSVDE